MELDKIQPAPENDTLYKPIDPSDPAIIALAESIRDRGQLEPIVATQDGYILSGHRRYVACQLAGKTMVKVRLAMFCRSDDPDRFITLLREYNLQREKSLDEKLREAVLSVNPDDAYQALVEYRESKAHINTKAMTITGTKTRCRISAAKAPFLKAIWRVLRDEEEQWPISVRRIHYGLLNDPPLKHASKPDSRYVNDRKSSNSLTELATRARIAGEIPMHAICDETRPVITWDCHREPSSFIAGELENFLLNYSRDLMQSQPNHIEIMCEKNTIAPLCERVAMRYRIPLTSGRGFCSTPPRNAMAERFKRSGKQKLIILMLSDHDPDGDTIAHSFARCVRDDFGIENIHPIKVALTYDQVRKYNLPPGAIAKPGSATRKEFVAKYGEYVFELEALPSATLEEILTEAIDSVLDMDAFNSELQQERKDVTWLAARRKIMLATLSERGGE